MPNKQTVFAYVDGADLEGVASVLEETLDQLVADRKWVLGDVWVVNQRDDGPAPLWDLGINLTLPAAKTRPKAWVDDIAAIATALGALHERTGRKLVMGIHDSKADTTKDLFFVDSEKPDLEKLRAAFAAVG